MEDAALEQSSSGGGGGHSLSSVATMAVAAAAKVAPASGACGRGASPGLGLPCALCATLCSQAARFASKLRQAGGDWKERREVGRGVFVCACPPSPSARK